MKGRKAIYFNQKNMVSLCVKDAVNVSLCHIQSFAKLSHKPAKPVLVLVDVGGRCNNIQCTFTSHPAVSDFTHVSNGLYGLAPHHFASVLSRRYRPSREFKHEGSSN
jgi:hypothetical protein